jgi:hypothetical protein
VKTIGFILFISFLPFFPVQAQDSTSRPTTLSCNGYIKNLETLDFDHQFRDVISGNLVHNRINFKWKPSSRLTAAAEFRNRVFWGENIASTPGFINLLRNENEVFDLSKTWIQKNNFLVHTNIERFWWEYRETKWNLRLGRQRINWGIATTWNPNDIFNTYNFLDFDYEERPGTDALKAQYLFNDFSHIEIATSPGILGKQTIGAVKYFVNKWGYDLQWIGGVFQHRFTTGIGWAGNVGNAGFKGEAQLFSKYHESGTAFNGTAEISYMFKNGWYASSAFLYAGEGLSKPVIDWTTIDFSPSPLRLMPTRWNLLLSASREFTPLLSGHFTFVYAPGVNLLIGLPSVSYSMAENGTVDLVWQSFFSELNSHFKGVSHRCFLRIKWNF